MPKVSKSALVLTSAELFYQMVNDIESYPQFLEGCERSEIIQQTDDEIWASLTINKSGFSQSFQTRNSLKHAESISMNLVDGPFKHLHGVWRFTSLDSTACKVEFELDFEFKNKMMGVALNSAFKKITESMVQSFIERAKWLKEKHEN